MLSHITKPNFFPYSYSKVYVNKMSPYSNRNYLSSTVSVVLSYYCGVELTCIPIPVKTTVEMK